VNQEKTHDLLARLIDRIATNSNDQAAEMMTEESADFLSAERAARERQQFFLDTPQVIGFAGQVATPGSFMTATVMNIPVVVTRDEKNVLRAMINACGHRGARVAFGEGVGRRFTCRSHGWTYNARGELLARPKADCFDAPDERLQLTQLPVSDRGGLLVVGLDPAMPQQRVDEHLAEIEDELVGCGLESMRTLETRRFEVRANWKLVAALSYESYHFSTLHRDTVAQWFAPNAVHDFFGKHSRWAFALLGTEQLAQKDRAEWPDTVPGAVSHALFPGTILITTPTDAQILRGEPGPTPDTSVVQMIGGYRDEAQLEQSRAGWALGIKAFEGEDLPAAEESQRGLAGGRDRLLIGRNEPVVQFWHQQWRNALKD
jgi:phenylpropionate dioxygenase-like ring-hydroxylating dioxygenase large terminal subunit